MDGSSGPAHAPVTAREENQHFNGEVSQESLENWIAETMARALEFEVSDPETTGSFLNKTTTFLLKTEPHRFVVRRRYSDFEWLYKTLSNRYFGMLLPPLPPKSAVKSAYFITSRTRGLSLFMDNLRMQVRESARDAPASPATPATPATPPRLPSTH